MLLYNTEWRYDYGMAVCYCGFCFITLAPQEVIPWSLPLDKDHHRKSVLSEADWADQRSNPRDERNGWAEISLTSEGQELMPGVRVIKLLLSTHWCLYCELAWSDIWRGISLHLTIDRIHKTYECVCIRRTIRIIDLVFGFKIDFSV